MIFKPTVTAKTIHFRKNEIVTFAFFSPLIIILTSMLFYSSTLEDSFITFRYAKHFAEGYGPGAWNRTGEQVEGYTSISWMMLSSLAHYLNFNMLTFSKLAGIASHIVISLSLILFPLYQKRLPGAGSSIPIDPNIMVLTGIFLSLYLPISWYATTGMETVPYMMISTIFILFMTLQNKSLPPALIGPLLILTRPEGILVSALGICLSLLIKNFCSKQIWFITGFMMAAIVCLEMYRFFFFGDLLPNTYYAKAGGSGLRHFYLGKAYLSDWLKTHYVFIPFFLLALYFFIRQIIRNKINQETSIQIILLVFTVVYLSYIIKVGGDNYSAFPFWRHFIHIIPLLILILSFSIVASIPGHRYLQLTLILIIVFTTNHEVLQAHNKLMATEMKKTASSYPHLSHAPHNRYYTWLKNITDSTTTVASSLGGELPFVVDAIHIDNLGLSTRHIAHNGKFNPDGYQDSKSDMKWVLKQRPDIIEGYIRASYIIQNKPLTQIISNARFKMNNDLVTSPIFQNEYLFLVNGPYENLNRALFLRKTYWEHHPQKNKLQCVPVYRTSLKITELTNPL